MKFTAYEGDRPYVFISYAHKDRDRVFEIVAELERQGYRYWYDEGIAPGSEWPEDVAAHLNRAAMLMAFISANSMQSENCRREINFALSKGKPFLSVVLEKTEMPLGMEMQLSAHQSILRYNYSNWADFIDKIVKCPSLIPCQGEASSAPTPRQTANAGISQARKEAKLMEVFTQALAYAEKGEYVKELTLLLDNWELGCDNGNYMVKLGRAYRRNGMTAKAIEYYEKAKELNPKDPTIYSNMAIAYVTTGQYAPAKPLFEQAIAMAEGAPLSLSQNDFASIYGNYALCIGLMGDMKGARKYLKIAKDKGYAEKLLNDKCEQLHINPRSIGRRFFF